MDQEATEDEEIRAAYSVDIWTRSASYEANQDLTEQARRYREVLERAAESDRVVRDNWEEWADRIGILCWDEVSPVMDYEIETRFIERFCGRMTFRGLFPA